MTYGRRQDLLGEWTMDRTNTPGPRPVLHMSADALLSPSRSLKSRYPVFGGGRPLGFGLDLRPTAERRGRRGRPLLAGWEALTQPQRHPAASLASAATHVAILLLALFFPRSEHKDTAGRVESQSRSVRMVYLLPKEVKPKPRPQHQVMPAFAAPVSRPGQESPSPTTTEAAPEHDAPAATSPQPRPRTGEAGRSSTVEREDAMVSEARRLFGPKAHTGATLAGPVAAGLPVGLNGGGTRCAWSGEEARRVEGPGTGVIEGIVRTESSGRPIAGAFLQLLGSGSATFADASGRYRLTFDPALVGVCRSQLVRVTAPGFRARTMILRMGFPSDNVIDLAVRP
jgi:hypothetical protein